MPEELDSDTTIHGLRLLMTCGACPEQYDVFDQSGKQVGYLRLRHGQFRADVPDCGGETVYEAFFNDTLQGQFDSPEQRQRYLQEAVTAILAHGKKENG